ncbi:MAG: ABC transporter ATP-binding protein [Candidatus Riflebacteria bacterium]|nr:ABC transporter ATP-binding protein [Candidatus Riflebacteria bacterium]
MIEIRGLTKKYGEFPALDDLDLEVGEGEIVAFLGPNGAGKTTTIRLLMGILVPTSGTATVCGLDCFADRAEVKRHVGYLPENPIFYDYMRGRELLEFLGEMHGQERPEARRRAMQLIEEFDLAEASEEYAVNYSTGMKKKLALAAAMMHDPKVLILDEPTNGLDPRAARDMDDRLREEVARGKTIFLSTHLLDRAEKLSSRIAIIHQGRLVVVGTAVDLKEKLVAGGTPEEVFLHVTGAPAQPIAPAQPSTQAGGAAEPIGTTGPGAP